MYQRFFLLITIIFSLMFSSDLFSKEDSSLQILYSINYSNLKRLGTTFFSHSYKKEESHGNILHDIISHYGKEETTFCPDYRSSYDSSSPIFTYKLSMAYNECIANKFSISDTIHGFYLLNGKSLTLNKSTAKLLDVLNSYFSAYSDLIQSNSLFNSMFSAILQKAESKDLAYVLDEWVAFSNQDLETLDLIQSDKTNLATDSLIQDVGSSSLFYLMLVTFSTSNIDKFDPSYFSKFSNQANFMAAYKHLYNLTLSVIFNPKYNSNSSVLHAQWLSFLNNPNSKNLLSWLKRKYLYSSNSSNSSLNKSNQQIKRQKPKASTLQSRQPRYYAYYYY